MTPKIQQNIIPRNRQTGISRSSWKNSSTRKFVNGAHTHRFYQKGSVDNTTITITFGLTALVIVGMLGFFYLQQVVNTASQGTDVHSLETRIVELKEKQRELELEGAQLRSLQAVGTRIEKLNLVTADKVSYLASTPKQVAIAE